MWWIGNIVAMTYNVRTGSQWIKCSCSFQGHFRVSRVAVLTVLACFLQEITAAADSFFTQVPGDVTVIRGNVARFPWSSDAGRVSFVHWQKEPELILIGTLLPEDGLLRPLPSYQGRVRRLGMFGFELLDVTEADQGNYRITAFLGSGNIQDVATLNVTYPPTDTSVSATATIVKEGDRLQLSCTTRSNPPSLLRWYKDGAALNNPTAQVVGGTVVIHSVSREDSGRYRCQASNGLSPDGIDVIDVTVQSAADSFFTQVPGDVTVLRGDVARFPWSFGDGGVSLVQWLKQPDGTLIGTLNPVANTLQILLSYQGRVRRLGMFGFELSNVTEGDVGNYRITVYFGAGTQPNDVATLNVTYPPTDTTVSATETTVHEGNQLQLSCATRSNPPSSFLWYKDGVALNNPTAQVVSGTVVIPSVSREDSGRYRCQASNGLLPDGIDVIDIAVQSTNAKPTTQPTSNNFRRQNDNYKYIIATTVSAFCLIVLVVILTFYWRRRRSKKGCKSDNVSSSSNDLIHIERLEYLCPDMNVILVSNATELDKMADPVLLEFWDCLARMDVDPVIVFLREKRSLSVDETAGVRAAPCVVERLLEILCVLKGDQASSVLSDALRHSDQTHLADLLDGKVLPDAKCVTIATTTETSFGITFRPAYKNPQHFGDVDKYLVTLELTTPEPKIIVKRRISASDPLQAEFSGLEQGTSYNVTVISKRGDVRSAGVTVTITTIGGYEEPSRLLQRFNVEEQSKIHHVLIYKDKITLLEPLGNGNFGEVRHGVYRKGKKWVECAAKTLYDTAAPNEMVSLLQEGLRMIKFNHDNVLELTGICVHGNQAMIVLPYMKHGDLRKYLIKKQTLPLLENLRLCLDIARGMAYLSDNDIVHRDLAARNCMLDENLRVKVADFGLCRDVHEKGYYRIQSWEVKLPYKWMAPESHATYIFDTKTDIWSYGIVLWEIFAAGQTPYPGMPGVSIVHQLREGYRMERPNRCPIMLYNSVMKQCWLTNPLERPNFKEVLRKVEQIHTSFKHRSDFENTDVQVHSLA